MLLGAGRPLTPATTHVKTEVVVNYLAQVWGAADALASGATIQAADFTEAASMTFPYKFSGILDYELPMPVAPRMPTSTVTATWTSSSVEPS